MIAAAESLNAELRAADQRLVDNADVLRGILAGCGDCIKILDLSGRLQFMSEGGKRVMEVDDFSKLKGCPWPDFWAGMGNLDAINAVESARLGQASRFKGAANTAKGTPRYWDVQVSPIFDANGKPSHLLSISRDITAERDAEIELREAAARQRLLADELNHRIKNTLAMVGAIAEQTMRGLDVDAARKAFSARLVTLSRAHDILTQTSWVSASITEVVHAALAPHRASPQRIRAHGPEVHLPPKSALALSLALHELATNALKYGALSNEVGKVDITWEVKATDSGETFAFTWAENGGPPVTVDHLARRKGFGSRLIQDVLAHDFAGKVQIGYEPTGLICQLISPLAHLMNSSE